MSDRYSDCKIKRYEATYLCCLPLRTQPLGGLFKRADLYDDEWGSEDLESDGKFDGLVDHARTLEFGSSSTGSVTSDSIDLFRLELVEGDKFQVVMKTTSGSLSPHVTLHQSLLSTLRSTSFDISGSVLTKTYEAKSTGRHFLAARAFRNRGEGNYSLVATCTGGPCDGEFVVEELDEDDIEGCLELALRCAIEDIKRFNGAVGPSRARRSLDDCLMSGGTPDGLSCATACESSVQNNFGPLVCSEIVEELQFYADQSDECTEALDDCLVECDQGGFSEVSFSTCYTFGFNGTCASYVHTREECGGAFSEGSDADCHLFCEATVGASVDDLDTLCDDDCGPRPDVLDDF